MNLENRVRVRLGLPLRLSPDIRHDFPTSAVMIIRRCVEHDALGDQPDTLAVGRAGNMIGYPGGSVEWFETPREAAIREALEETGITVPLHAVHDLGCWLDGSPMRRPTFAFYCTLPAGGRPIGYPRQVEVNHPVSWVYESALCSPESAEFFAWNRRAVEALRRYRFEIDSGFGQGFDLKLWRAYLMREISASGLPRLAGRPSVPGLYFFRGIHGTMTFTQWEAVRVCQNAAGHWCGSSWTHVFLLDTMNGHWCGPIDEDLVGLRIESAQGTR